VLLINAATTNEFVALFGSDGNDVYYAEYYDAANESLVNPTFIERNVQGVITRRISARQAVWDGEYWILHDAHSYTWENANADVVHREHGTARLTNLEITPQSFQRAELQIGEMDIQEARDHIAVRRESGLPFRRELTIYHKRFAFSCTSLVVAIISCGIGGILKRNTLLLSMLLSLSVTVLYYVTGLITDLFAFNGYIAPAVAAWLPVCLFFVGGGFALKNLIHS